MCEDTTYLACSKSNDPSTQVVSECISFSEPLLVQADFYSGRKGHGQCVQIGNGTDPTGYCWAVLPGKDLHDVHSLLTQMPFRLSSKYSPKSRRRSCGKSCPWDKRTSWGRPCRYLQPLQGSPRYWNNESGGLRWSCTVMRKNEKKV